MAESTLSFAPIAVDRDVEELTRPSQSYWEDAWIRLKQNKRAFVSLFVVIFMVLFAIFGPLVSRFSFDEQDLDQTSKAPWSDRTVKLISLESTWIDPKQMGLSSDLTSPDQLEIDGEPNFSYVRLVWSQVIGASSYLISRNIVENIEGQPTGLPLAIVRGSESTHFEDLLDLRPRTYWYAITALNADGEAIGPPKSLEVSLQQAVSVADAVANGWITEESGLTTGDSFKLPWHPLGTDYLGRDMFARLAKGAQVSLFIGILAPLAFMLIGILYGSVAGYFAGAIDQLLMRFADFVVALPFLLFMILFKLVFGIESGSSGILAMLVALILLSWPATARLVRGEVLRIREEGYVSASRLLGTETRWLILRHMIPNTMGVILVTFTFAVPSAIFTEAFLSFIGMGVEPPTPSWGSMCNEGRKTMETTPHELIFPAIFISITVLAFNLLGDGLRDALDAKMRSRE